MKRNKGISLIVLVITIIVMVILAGAIILTLNNSGIINKAGEAVKATNEATVKEVASLGWAEAYADGARTEEELKAGVVSALEKNNIEPEDYGMVVTTSGVTIKKGWLKDGFTLVKGDKVLGIGDSIAYDETAGGTKTVATNVDWKVLGADEQGNLLIMSAGDVKTGFRLGYESTMTTAEAKLVESIKDMETGVSQLNAECLPYGYGEGVVGQARCITAEDVNSVTGYNPETASNGNPYRYGELGQYGNKVTYSYNGTTKPAYSSVVKSGTLTTTHSNGFYYYNGEKVVHINDLTTGTNGNVFATLTSDYYYYYAPDLTTIIATDNAKAYSMIFGNDDTYYWLASPCVYTWADIAYFGMRHVYSGYVGSYGLFYSDGSSYYNEHGVRAVVTLSSDITLTGDSRNGWSY